MEAEGSVLNPGLDNVAEDSTERPVGRTVERLSRCDAQTSSSWG